MSAGVSVSAMRLLGSVYSVMWKGHRLVTASSTTSYVGWAMPGQPLPKKVLFSMPDSEWRKPKGGQSLTGQKGMKSVAKSLGSLGASDWSAGLLRIIMTVRMVLPNALVWVFHRTFNGHLVYS